MHTHLSSMVLWLMFGLNFYLLPYLCVQLGKVSAILHICPGSGADPESGKGFQMYKVGYDLLILPHFSQHISHENRKILSQRGEGVQAFACCLCDKYQKLMF